MGDLFDNAPDEWEQRYTDDQQTTETYDNEKSTRWIIYHPSTGSGTEVAFTNKRGNRLRLSTRREVIESTSITDDAIVIPVNCIMRITPHS